MRLHLALAVFLVVCPVAVGGEQAPEELLPATAQAYYRWDGVDAHAAAYANSSLGQMLQGDTGAFFVGLARQLEDAVSKGLIVETLMRGESPIRLLKLQGYSKAAARLLGQVGKRGFIACIDIRGLEPPRAQLTVIIPGGGDDIAPLSGAIRLGAGLAKADVKEVRTADRKVWNLDLDGAHLAWWVEGKHAVLAVGTETPEMMVKAITAGNHVRLTKAPLFQRMTSFKDFETVSRGFLDTEALAKLGAGRSREVRRLLDDLGAEGLHTLVAYSGFEGKVERGLLELNAAGPRKGALALLGGKPFTLGDVPPLPPDVVTWSMTNFDPARFYDVLLKTIENVVGVLYPEGVPAVQAFPKAANDFLGIDLRDDLLGALEGRVVQYSSPGEGVLTLGQTVLFRVKDSDKLEASLDQAIKALGRAAGVPVRIRKRPYRGTDMRVVEVRQQGFIFVPTYAIHDGWLAAAFYPQPVEGFIARARGAMPAWKPSPDVAEMLSKLPHEFIGVSYSDPRPTLRQLLSIAPLIGGSVASFVPQLNFDVGSVPNSQEVVRHLFPNVSVTTDDGKVVRSESRGSLELPLEVSGLDAYSLFLLFALGRLGI